MRSMQSISKLVRVFRPVGVIALVLFLGAAPPPKKAHRPTRLDPRQIRTILSRVDGIETRENLLYDIVAPDALPAARRLRTLRMEVTAYCPCKKCCGPKAAGVTASGLPVSHNAGRFVAADTDMLPFGTRLVIPGYDAGPVEVIDRGSAIKGRRIDVYFPTHDKALEWGRQWLEVVVLE